MNFVFISPNFPQTYWQFCDRLNQLGVRVLGIGDQEYDSLKPALRSSLTEYYRVSTLEDYDQVFRAVAFFSFKYGKIDWLESNNEYWLEQDARLRTDFHITTGISADEIGQWKSKSGMKPVYAAAGIPTARCHPIQSEDGARQFLESIGGYPVIVKPDIGVGASGTWKLENDSDWRAFFDRHLEAPYVMEEFVEGEICSYDAITDEACRPLFESMTVWPPVADIVNLDLDLAYYTSRMVPTQLKEKGRAALAAFHVRSRFVHLEFFRMKKERPGLGKPGDFVGLEVNMRPAGGYTPDMMNFAHSTDVYRIYAEMVRYGERRLPDSGDHHYCVYASRKNGHRYTYSHGEILERWGARMAMCEEMPELMWETMGRYMYTVHAYSMDEVRSFIAMVHGGENRPCGLMLMDEE